MVSLWLASSIPVTTAERAEELDEGAVIADLQSDSPSFARIRDLRSLTVIRVSPGDLVYMPAHTVHDHMSAQHDHERHPFPMMNDVINYNGHDFRFIQD